MKQIKFWLFNDSAVSTMMNIPQLQSVEFDLGAQFVQYLRGVIGTYSIHGLYTSQSDEGVLFSGEAPSKKSLIFDLTACKILSASDADISFILQKAFRSAVRIWNSFPLSSSEKLLKDNDILLFPFPFSKNGRESYRLVFHIDFNNSKTSPRGIDSTIIAYKYGTEGANRGPTQPTEKVIKLAAQFYQSQISNLRQVFSEEDDILKPTHATALYEISAEGAVGNAGFKYMPYEHQLKSLTTSQKAVVEHPNMNAPIRVVGPAGTGKTLSLVLRAVRLLQEAKSNHREIQIAFFTHNNSTELSVKTHFESVAGEEWCQSECPQRIIFSTLQHYCADYIHVREQEIMDADAYEAKQGQISFISDGYDAVIQKSFATYKHHLSAEMVNYLEKEQKERIVVLLQHEFSIQIKGRALGNLDIYLSLPNIKNGLPIHNDDDKTFIFKIYSYYQNALEQLHVYDTDDVVLQATSLFNAPFWRRERIRKGFDYIFVDEMHLFNVNEQQTFHFLSKDIAQKTIPMCFALDYAQAIGDRGNIDEDFAEKTFTSTAVLTQEYKTVFRNSPPIAELCAAITASGPDLFNLQNFINPYKDIQMNFTAREEALFTKPQILMYETDGDMIASLKEHVESILTSCHCALGDIAIIPFSDDLITKEHCEKIIGKKVISFSGRNSFAYDAEDSQKKRAFLLPPENVNGLEFDGVILLGIDEGRVPPSGTIGVSANHLRYSALNKLYLACSRAKYKVIMLGTIPQGDSPCLQYALQNKFIEKAEISRKNI